MNCIYNLRKDVVKDEDGQYHTVYGIEAVDADGKVLQSFEDIFFDLEKAVEFVELCNQNKLELIHLEGVVEDALAEQNIIK